MSDDNSRTSALLGFSLLVVAAVAVSVIQSNTVEAPGAIDSEDSPAAPNGMESSTVPPAVAWRNDGTGHYEKAAPPAKWSNDTNVLWHSEVGEGHSSPVVHGDRVFITSDPDWLICIDLNSGQTLWKKSNGSNDLTSGRKGSDIEIPSEIGFAVPTPVIANGNVYVLFGTGVVACFDLAGTRRWIRWLERRPEEEYGRSASPLLVGGKLIVHVTHLIALDPKTGQTLWENEEAESGYGSPVAARVGTEDIVITPKGAVVRVRDGTILANDIEELKYASPVVHGDIVYFIGATAAALRITAKGDDEVEAEEIWVEPLDGDFYASPVIFQDLTHTVNNSGLYTVLDSKTGEIQFSHMLTPTPEGEINFYPCLNRTGDRIMVHNDQGLTVIIEAGRKYQEFARNAMDEGAPGTPTFAGAKIIMRCADQLFCIGKSPSSATRPRH